uniref:Uncharacterized protein n=1 Tax=Chenopodium quinoa TaxID=63459 RepID=A0A803MEL1_CHEQI
MATDANSVLYLHPNDGSYSISVDKLTGAADYKSWRRYIEIALTSKKKIYFVLGTVLRSTYAQDAVKADQWDTCNSMVISWIHACLSDTIKNSVLYINSARETWIQLENRFSMGNGSRKYKLNKDLYQLKQHNNSINEYYTAMSSLWEELDSMNALPVISEPSADVRNLLNVVARNQEDSRLFQFLNGLDDHFSAMRSQMLMLTPLPTVESACSMLQQEESQREVLLPQADPDISAILNPVNNAGKGKASDQPWNSKAAPRLAATTQTSQAGAGTVTFTQQQFEQFLKHFPSPNAVKGSETDEELDINFSGMVSCHHASTLKYGWIIDSGASDHMTCDLSKFVEPKAAAGFPKITLPTDAVSKKIRGVGKARNVLYYLVDKPLSEDEITQHQDVAACLTAKKDTAVPFAIWHHRLGHASLEHSDAEHFKHAVSQEQWVAAMNLELEQCEKNGYSGYGSRVTVNSDVSRPKGDKSECKLIKSLYGLKQAPRQWFSKLSSTLISFGYKRSRADYSLFVKDNNSSITAVLVYVDDLIITGNDVKEIQTLKSLLSSHFHMKDLGKLRYFLGLEIDQFEQGIFISQRKYIHDLLKDQGMLNVKPLKLPMDSHLKLRADKGTSLSNPVPYQHLLGKLIYLTVTRSDIAFSVQILSKFM